MSFSLFGIPVVIRPIFWLVALMLGAPGGTSPREMMLLGVWVAVLFVSILAHELGHAFAMRAYGREPSIELWGLGGLTHWGDGPPVSPGKDIVVSLAGPGAGLALGAVVFAAQSALAPTAGSLAAEAVRHALWINVGWGLLNLLPIVPLDGGHVLESALSLGFGSRGRRLAHGVSLLLAGAAVLYALWTRQLWIAFLAAWCAALSWRKWSEPAAATAATPLTSDAQEAIKRVYRLLAEDDPEGAESAAQVLLRRLAADDGARTATLEALAWAQIEGGRDDEAIASARQMTGSPSELLAARLAVAEGRFEEGVQRLERELSTSRSDLPALVLSSVYLNESRADLTLALLRSERGAKLQSTTHLKLGAQLFFSEHFDLALAAAEHAFERFGENVFAYNAACSCARLGRVDAGLDWLERAVETGFDDAAHLEGDADLNALRSHPRFSELALRLAGDAPGPSAETPRS
jgi:Zn-dependent protease